MDKIFLNVVSLSISISIVIVFLLLLMPMISKNFIVKWRYYVWLIIGVRLLVPFNYTLSLSALNINVKTYESTTKIPVSNVSSMQNINDTYKANESVYVKHTLTGLTEQATKSSSDNNLSVLMILEIIWIIGFLLFLLIQLISYMKFKRHIKNSKCYNIADNVDKLWEKLGKDANIKRLPRLKSNSYILSPVFTGLFNSILYLPRNDYSEDELKLIFQHELIHYKRKDLYYKLILMLANALHWFNPIIYYFNYTAGKDLELSCDNEVINIAGKESIALYGKAILKALPKRGTDSPITTMQFGSTKKEIKRRLDNLFDFRNKGNGIFSIIAIFVALVFFTGAISLTPTIDGINISIDKIPANAVECIGEVDLSPGKVLNIDVQAKTGSDFYVALSKNPDFSGLAKAGEVSQWQTLVGSKDTNKASLIATLDFLRLYGEYYVFIITQDTDITGVAGSVYLGDTGQRLQLNLLRI